MVANAINRLNAILRFAPTLLSDISAEEMSEKPAPDKWSKKEILGHLIDSATNNHQRFVRGQFELNPEIGYHTDNWVRFNYYQDMEIQQMISFWAIYNRQLLELIKRIPVEHITREVRIGNNLQPLGFLVADYVEHLEHHLKQIINYSE